MFQKVLTFLLFAGTVATATSVPATAFASVGDTVLEYGSQGPDVQTLQQQLQTLGYFPDSVGITQYFGSVTKEAVIAFKNDHNLTNAEKVGKTTEAEIVKALSNHQNSLSSSDQMREKIVTIAKNLNGTPYSWGGTTPSGFDCSGFTRYVFSQVGISLPRTSVDQYGNGKAVDKAALKNGDLVFFSTYDGGASHVGIYLGSGQFIHAASEKVQIDSINDPYYWADRYIGAKTVLN